MTTEQGAGAVAAVPISGIAIGTPLNRVGNPTVGAAEHPAAVATSMAARARVGPGGPMEVTEVLKPATVARVGNPITDLINTAAVARVGNPRADGRFRN